MRNQRDILQLFNIKAVVYPERVEITGTIPTQIPDNTHKEGNKTAPIISSLSHRGRGVNRFFQTTFKNSSPLNIFSSEYFQYNCSERWTKGGEAGKISFR